MISYYYLKLYFNIFIKNINILFNRNTLKYYFIAYLKRFKRRKRYIFQPIKLYLYSNHMLKILLYKKENNLHSGNIKPINLFNIKLLLYEVIGIFSRILSCYQKYFEFILIWKIPHNLYFQLAILHIVPTQNEHSLVLYCYFRIALKKNNNAYLIFNCIYFKMFLGYELKYYFRILKYYERQCEFFPIYKILHNLFFQLQCLYVVPWQTENISMLLL